MLSIKNRYNYIILISLLFWGAFPHKHKKIQEDPWIKFYKEEVKITVDKEEVEVEGLYYFKSFKEGTINAKINYPFYIDNKHLFPYEIKVDSFKFWKEDSSVCWFMNFKPFESKTFRFFYKQKIFNKKVVYILSSTLMWETPIEKASFVISVPTAFKNIKISLKPKKIEVIGGRKYFYILKNNFRSKDNLIISWN